MKVFCKRLDTQRHLLNKREGVSVAVAGELINLTGPESRTSRGPFPLREKEPVAAAEKPYFLTVQGDRAPWSVSHISFQTVRNGPDSH